MASINAVPKANLIPTETCIFIDYGYIMTNLVRTDFPAFSVLDKEGLVYLDSAATSQKPKAVIDVLNNTYQQPIGNVHRSGHQHGRATTLKFEQVRDNVASFIGAQSSHSIIWTKGTTEAINLVAFSWGMAQLKVGDEIVLSQMEHHANLVPWQQLAKSKGLLLKWIPVTVQAELDLEVAAQLINSNTKLVAICHVSNALGTINPIDRIISLAKSVNARVLIDGAQAVAHLTVDVTKLDCDFYTFSGHKLYGPSGIGALYVKPEALEEMTVWQTGGEMVRNVTQTETSFQETPLKFEAGTPNIEGVIGLGAAIDYLNSLKLMELWQFEQDLLQNLLKQCQLIPQFKLLSKSTAQIPLLSFQIKNQHCLDVATLLDEQGIAIRAGHHCAMPLMQALDSLEEKSSDEISHTGSLRVSIGIYNNQQDIDSFCQALKIAIELLEDE